ncbi:MAG: hypothetical protein ACYDH6_22160 [Acidimicrobiales bacterium]
MNEAAAPLRHTGRVYDADEVDAYVAGLLEHIEILTTEFEALHDQTESERLLGRALLQAQDLGDEARRELEAERAEIIARAEAEARAIVEAARENNNNNGTLPLDDGRTARPAFSNGAAHRPVLVGATRDTAFAPPASADLIAREPYNGALLSAAPSDPFRAPLDLTDPPVQRSWTDAITSWPASLGPPATWVDTAIGDGADAPANGDDAYHSPAPEGPWAQHFVDHQARLGAHEPAVAASNGNGNGSNGNGAPPDSWLASTPPPTGAPVIPVDATGPTRLLRRRRRMQR